MYKVALVRGRHLNKFEMQFYEPLVSKYKLRGFGSLSCYHDQFSFPVTKLPSPIDLLAITNRLKIPQRPILGVLNRLFIDSQYLYGLENQLRGFDIAHAADTFYHFTHQCIVAKKKGFVPKVVATVFENIPFNNEGIWGRRNMKQGVIKNVDHFLAISRRAKAALVLEGCPEDKITVITQAIDTHKFFPRRINKNASELTILFSGRLEWYKGIYEVIYAAALLLKDYDLKDYRLQFFLIGDGSEKNKLLELERRLGIEKFINHQSVSYDLMPKIYQKADIYVAPSQNTLHYQEQFSTVLLEAQSSGLPIVTTSCGGIPENVGEAALIVGAGDFYGLSQAIKRLILDPNLRYKLGEKARERAVKYFDNKIIASKIDKIYQILLSK